ncbi:methylated-DNA--[protein]-cysteine S-methyltransferase [Lysinibacillus agricola]|uniref:Methylated-DNA--[protein]-cysteine S-methyltransferase n=1 Tax=Lysinibacillus agricola TaxID=2590012 RepID=A0ABX7ALB1_9BACI|nr:MULTISPECIES: methylated-DNA--[protein]-cysteine S-methyltransferase [Lysinibacillus]KOS59882.1 cysteine methyltransferase [Lysinibacillus sp. FJAT-14222]QQP10663.1 methylated-DNA--[protein]-cysteine S-methyltransferase [Lysinibacillus agricola]
MNTNNEQNIYWSLLTQKEWRIYVAATSNNLLFVGSQNQSFEELSDWVKKKYPKRTLVENKELLNPYLDEIIEYLEGKRTQFTFSIDYKGTPFQLSVWNALNDIPYGQTKTYSDIANYINKPSAVRAVGIAIGANPALLAIPCHRVVGKNGTLTGYRGGLEMKKKLLELENSSLKK